MRSRFRGGPLGCAGRRPLETKDLRTGVGQHHGGVRGRPDPGQFDDLDAAERSGSRCVRHGRIVPRVARRGQAGAMLIARAPGRVTLIGDHTDYNQGLSLPMAIDLATEATFTPKPGSFLVGVASDQFAEPWEIALNNALGTTTPSPPQAVLAGALLALAHPSSGGAMQVTSTIPVGAGLSSSAAFSVAFLLALGLDQDLLELATSCQSAEEVAGARVGLLDPLAILGARAGHALVHRFRHTRHAPGSHPRDGGIRGGAQRDRPRAGSVALRRPPGRMRVGGEHHRQAARSVRARRPERAAGLGAAPPGTARDHRVRPGTRGRAPLRSGQSAVPWARS